MVKLLLKSSLLLLCSCYFTRVEKSRKTDNAIYLYQYGRSNQFTVLLDTSAKFMISHYLNSQLLFSHVGVYNLDSSKLTLNGFKVRKYRTWIYSKDSLILNQDKDIVLHRFFKDPSTKDTAVRFRLRKRPK